MKIDGRQHNLGPDKQEAHRKFHELMAAKPAPVASDLIAKLLDAFIVSIVIVPALMMGDRKTFCTAASFLATEMLLQ